MNRLSLQLKGYTGANPFRESQARTYGDEKIVSEFYPTSFYWSLFNEQHEILLGTRGSGKTVLLKMLTYSLLKRFHHPQANHYVAEKVFIGFYVPLHLEFLVTFQTQEATDNQKIQYFQFAFNCHATKSLLYQVAELLEDNFPETKDRLLTESKIVDHLTLMWFPDLRPEINSIKDLQWQIDILYNKYDFLHFLRAQETGQLNTFAKPILIPILNVLQKLTEDLGLNVHKTNWVICIDEAEFLQEPFIRCINTFLRSEKRPLVLKIATLPFKHSTCETLLDSVYIEPNGSDFNYRKLDMDWDSSDFKGLTDHLLRVRLIKCGISDEHLNLENFLGVEGKDDDLIDYYKLEIGEEANNEKILEGILNALSDQRKGHYADVRGDSSKEKRPIFNRFAPVYFMRRMKREASKGNRTVGWFAGAKVLRRVADGNPRRFIQIMNDMVEKARDVELTPKNQHRVLSDFTKRSHIVCEGLPKYGLAASNIISKIGELLSTRVHGTPMMDGGCNFYLERKFIEDQLIKKSIELAIAYSYIITDEKTLFTRVTETSNLRLAYICAVYYWLPMRKGDPPTIRQANKLLDLYSTASSIIPTTSEEARVIFSQLDLELVEQENE